MKIRNIYEFITEYFYYSSYSVSIVDTIIENCDYNYNEVYEELREIKACTNDCIDSEIKQLIQDFINNDDDYFKYYKNIFDELDKDEKEELESIIIDEEINKMFEYLDKIINKELKQV